MSWDDAGQIASLAAEALVFAKAGQPQSAAFDSPPPLKGKRGKKPSASMAESTVMVRPQEQSQAIEIRVRGRVQGVGFRPTVWRIAQDLGMPGEILNDAEGVLLRVRGTSSMVAKLLDRMRCTLPPLARIDKIETRPYCGELPGDFVIAASAGGCARTEVAPDAAICADCVAELRDAGDRRHRYPFTNCTHCGPRLSIVSSIPYDRAATTMAKFVLCDRCHAEYRSPSNRRFHAEAIACASCGPIATLVPLGRNPADLDAVAGAIDRAASLIQKGEILAIKGLGAYQLACDATKGDVVAHLRRVKSREAKPFALMARDVATIRCYCTVSGEEERELAGMQGPIVVLCADGPKRLPDVVAPGLRTLGFMLPTTALHFLLLQDIDVPLVMTSGNLSDAPPIIDDVEAIRSFAGIAAYALVHDREIANRIDDSVVRIICGRTRVLRRARGFAPTPIKLPAGFEAAPDLLAMGSELKATFCLVKDGQAIVSQHQGDLEHPATFDGYCRSLSLYRQLFHHMPAALVVDRHPEYLSSKFARAEAKHAGRPVLEVQHHHAHVAACLAENQYPLKGPAVLGVVLDGLGLGEDGSIWGGEFLLADYLGYKRLARFRPVDMPGAAQAVREPWRNLYAHLASAMGWDAFAGRYPDLEVHAYLQRKPRATLDVMMARGINAPKASSCGRLFDAVAAALGLCREQQAYEGEAAARLEALAEVAPATDGDAGSAYCIDIVRSSWLGLMELDPSRMWNAIMHDLEDEIPASTIALRFHKGVSQAVVEMTRKLARGDNDGPRFKTVALSGGCFQNRILFESTVAGLSKAGFSVLSHAEIPANDGGLSLGQAAIGAARLIAADAGSN